ncbi:MAG: AMMECR1 domain-containing protein, partial [Gammaproteobacteria bacterium]|nr:AMMECR1 domain-containing protein [Gammaproteobacteria bacterium]MBT5372118.1 AMMECR1 domain-containing protein [Gammaproteobacteria bacterium]
MTSTTPIELRQQMVKLVRQSIEQGLKMRSNHLPALNTLPKALRRPGASFVTLEMSHQLRGCIGSLEAHRPLAEDLIANGYSAAFRDPR